MFKFIITICLLSVNVFAYDDDNLIVSIDKDALVVNGPIISGFCGYVRSKFEKNIKTVRITSMGGDVTEGICLGEFILDRGLDVEVKDFCGSSCANYVFTAGKNKTIFPGAFVGFHGNAQSMMNKIDLKKQLTDSLPFYILAYYKVSGKFNEAVKDAQNSIDEIYEHEAVFLKSAGISQDLFIKTSKPDKGSGDGKEYSFLVPSVDEMNGYNIRNVTGVNSVMSCNRVLFGSCR